VIAKPTNTELISGDDRPMTGDRINYFLPHVIGSNWFTHPSTSEPLSPQGLFYDFFYQAIESRASPNDHPFGKNL
jgi:hypothetical protein